MKWQKPEGGFYASEIVAYGETQAGVPIIAHRPGVYPHLVGLDGKEPDSSIPTVTIYVDDDHQPVKASVKKYYQGRQYPEDLHIELKRFDAVQSVALITDQVVNDAIRRLDNKVSEHESLMKKLWDLPAQMSRKEYEYAASKLGVDAIPDSDIRESYGIKFGDFRWPEYTNDYVVKMFLARLRLKGMEEKQDSLIAENNQENMDIPLSEVVREYTMLVPVVNQHQPIYQEEQACLRPRDRFWDIPVPKIDSAFDNLLVPQPSWSPSTTQQLRTLVAAPYLAPI